MAFETYRPSGRMEPLTIPLAAGAGLVAAGAGSWLYQLIVDKVPFIYLNFIATAAYGGLIGVAVGHGARRGKCRNVTLAVLLALLCALAGDALTYRLAYDRRMETDADEIRASYETGPELGIEAYRSSKNRSDIEAKHLRAGVNSRGDLEAFKEGFGLGDYLALRVEEGWSVGSSDSGLPVSGIFVYVMWLLELGVIAGLAGFAAKTMAGLPFNEELGLWMPGEAVATVAGIDADALRTAAREGDVEALLDPQAKEKGGRFAARYTAFTCPGSDHCYLSVELKWKEKNGSKEQDGSEGLVTRARFSTEDIEKLRANVMKRT